MEDAINSGSWQQPNTFMDIMVPRGSNTSARSAPKHSETLMRSAVKKPEPQPEPATLEQATDDQNYAVSRPDLSESASLIEKSPLISRFATTTQEIDPTSESSIEQTVEQPSYPAMEAPANDVEASETAIQDFAPTDAEPLAIATEQPAINIFKNAPLTYDYAPVRSKKGRLDFVKRLSGWSVLAVAVVGLAIGGIYINANLNKFELYLASSRAGFSATLPKIKPSGYGLSSISTGGGVIEASFKSNSDNRQYTISEKKSSITTNQLLVNYVENQAGLNYQTINTNGRTIYVYNSHNAAWVSGGIWYVIQDNNSLSDSDIINIANSM